MKHPVLLVVDQLYMLQTFIIVHVEPTQNSFHQSVWLEIKQQYLKPLLLYHCYRPPSCNVSWLSYFSDSMENVFLSKKNVLLQEFLILIYLNQLVAPEYGLNSWHPSTFISWQANQHEFHNILQPLLTISFLMLLTTSHLLVYHNTLLVITYMSVRIYQTKALPI